MSTPRAIPVGGQDSAPWWATQGGQEAPWWTRQGGMPPGMQRPATSPVRPPTSPSGGKGGGGGQQPTTAGGLTDPFQGLSNLLSQQIELTQRWQDEQEASRRAAYAESMRRLGEVDKLFEGRDPFYEQVYQQNLQAGTRRADVWDREQQRQQRFGLLGRGLTGGSADVETQSRQRRRLGDVMGDVGARARQARRSARSSDEALRDRMRQGVLQGLPWQGAQAYRPMLATLPDFQGWRERDWNRQLGDLTSGGLFS